MGKLRGTQASLFMWAAMAALLTHNLVMPVMSSAAVFGDGKNFFFFPPPDPHAGGSPPISISPPTESPLPELLLLLVLLFFLILVLLEVLITFGFQIFCCSILTMYGAEIIFLHLRSRILGNLKFFNFHFTGSTPNPPSHSSGGSQGSPPSHGSGGGHGGTPPTNCGNPPSGGHHSPSPSPPKGSGGGHHNTPPSTPCTPCTPSAPHTPSTPHPPSTPTTPSPSTPTIISPPTTPGIITPSPPFDPNSPFPGTCDFWRTHPGFIWGLFGYWGTVGGIFGTSSLPFGANMSLLQALSVSRPDALGALYKEGTASLLNSMVNKRFPYSTDQVRNRFVAGVRSNRAAARQAKLFKLANEGKTKPRA